MSETTSARRMVEHQLFEPRELVAESPGQELGKPQPLLEKRQRPPLQPVRLPAWGERPVLAAQAFPA